MDAADLRAKEGGTQRRHTRSLDRGNWLQKCTAKHRKCLRYDVLISADQRVAEVRPGLARQSSFCSIPDRDAVFLLELHALYFHRLINPSKRFLTSFPSCGALCYNVLQLTI
jgi:hypothetical protein